MPDFLQYVMYRTLSKSLASYSGISVTSSDKIRDICARIVEAKDDDETLNRLLPQLREALHEHCDNLRRMVATEYPFHKDVAAD